MLAKRSGLTVVIMVLLAIAVGILSPSALAQDADGRVIPAYGRMQRFTLSPDGQMVATYENYLLYQIEESRPREEDLWVRLVDLATEDTLTVGPFTTPVHDVAFSPDGTLLATYHLDGIIHLWDTSSGSALNQFSGIFGGGRLAFLPDGKTLFAFNGGMAAFLWDIENGVIPKVLSFHPDSYGNYLAIRESSGQIFDVALAADGSGLGLGTATGEIWYWSLENDLQVKVRASTTGMMPGDAMLPRFLPDGRTLTYWDRSSESLRFVQVPSGLEYAEMVIEGGSHSSFTFAPDGETVAWGDGDVLVIGKLALEAREFTVTTEIPIALPDSLRGRIQQVAFTPDSRQVIVGGFRADDPAENLLLVFDVPE